MLQNLVNKTLREKRQDRDHLHWHVSSLGNCPCGQYLERLGKEPDAPYEDRTLRVFSIGNVFEGWLLDLLEAQLPKGAVERQISLYDESLDLSGHPDAIVTKDGLKTIYELKTIHSKGFWWMKKEGRSGYDHHRLQLWCYLYMTGIEKGNLVYLSKDDLTINEYPVFLNDEKIEKQAFDTLKTLNEAWIKKIPPEPITDEKDWRYKYCAYHRQCIETLS